MGRIITTPRGVFKMYEEFKTYEEAEQAGYTYYFTHDGIDIFICHFDRSNVYRTHFACVG